ncbi:MAG: hypothetical protein AB2L12_07625 [Smithellaceae bacterium]
MNTLLEIRVDDSIFALKKIRGALMIISEASQLDAQDYAGYTGQIEALSHIAEKNLEELGRIIKDLDEVAPKEEDE